MSSSAEFEVFPRLDSTELSLPLFPSLYLSLFLCLSLSLPLSAFLFFSLSVCRVAKCSFRKPAKFINHFNYISLSCDRKQEHKTLRSGVKQWPEGGWCNLDKFCASLSKKFDQNVAVDDMSADSCLESNPPKRSTNDSSRGRGS